MIFWIFLLKTTRIQWPSGSNSRDKKLWTRCIHWRESVSITRKSNRSTNGQHSSRCGLVGKRGRAGLSLLEMAACFMPPLCFYPPTGACWFYIHKWLVCFGSLGCETGLNADLLCWGGMKTLPRGLSSQGRTLWLLPLTTPCWSPKIKQQICPLLSHSQSSRTDPQ